VDRPLRQKPVRLGQEETNVKSQIIGLRVAGTVFALVCLGHLLRIITQADVLIAGRSLWMWRLSAVLRNENVTKLMVESVKFRGSHAPLRR